MCVATQGVDEITVGYNPTHAAVVFVEHSSTDNDAMLNGIGNINQVVRRYLNESA